MPLLLGTAAAVIGLGLSVKGNLDQREASQRATRIQIEQEAVRQRQAELEQQKRKRDLIRQSQAARSSALASATARGISSDDSAVSGAQAQITSGFATNIGVLNQNFQLRQEFSGLNTELSSARGDAAEAQALSHFGQQLFANSQTISRVGQEIPVLFNRTD